MIQKQTDELFMTRCLQIARNGLGFTYPNPFVGSVIVHNNKIIGEGFTSAYGGPHAEVNAINSVKDKQLLKDSNIYVTLEPCAHFGKTPPCCDLIIQHNFKRVVIGALDPHEKVNGKGFKKIKDSGIDVIHGILEDKCLELNKRFFTYQIQKRPYIILKWAQTQDNYMGHVDTQKWITNKYTKQLVHLWRAEEQAILVGKNTALIDNPKLNTRLWFGKNPLRIFIDKNLAIPKNFHLYDNSQPTIIFNQLENKKFENIELIKIDFNENIIFQILKVLYKYNIQSLIIEGGSNTIESFINLNLWDEARVLTSDITWNEGIIAPTINGLLVNNYKILNDNITIIKNNHTDD